MGHKVTHGYVTVPTAVAGGGVAYIDIPRGAVLPDDVPAEHLATLLERGHVELVDAADVDEVQPDPKVEPGPDEPVDDDIDEDDDEDEDDEQESAGAEPAEAMPVDAIVVDEVQPDPVDRVPAGAIPAVLAWVGDDAARAAFALDTEKAKATPRPTLVEALTKLVPAA